MAYPRNVTDSLAPRRGRPPVSSRGALEAVAFELLLRDGYEATTVQSIMDAGGVSRTTFFRYFGSKGGIVWGEFDRAIDLLAAALDAAGDTATVPAVLVAVAETTRLSRDAAPETWLDRFRLLDSDPALRGETAAHWSAWAALIARHVGQRTGSGAVAAAAVGGAVQAAYVALLREWSERDDPAAVDPAELVDRLAPLGVALQALVVPA